MATPDQIRRRGRWSLIVGILIAATALAAVAYADLIDADADVIAAGDQNSRNLGTVTPGAIVNTSASFELDCSGNKHVDSGQTVNIDFSLAGSTVPLGGDLSATNTTIGAISSSWPDDTTGAPNCGSAPSIQDNGDSSVTITAPSSAGMHTWVVRYTNALSPAGTNDASSITAATTDVTYTLSVELTDTDGDGVPDDEDNCPEDANADQADADGDGLGNACDDNSYVPEVATAAVDANGSEGDTLSTGGAFSDQDGNDTLEITKVSGDGDVTDNEDGTWSWSLATTDDGAGSVTVEASDGEHDPATDSFDWFTQNVPPTITSASFGTGNATCGTDNVSLNVDFTDPGTADTHFADVDWDNDGTYDQTVDPFVSDGSITHTYATAGSHTAKVRVTDDDGGVSNVWTATVLVNYNTSGILQPVNDTRNGQPMSVFKYKSTIPVKIKITDCDGSLVSTLTPTVSFKQLSGNPPTEGADEAASTVPPTDGNTMRWDSVAQQYMYNLATKQLGTDASAQYRITVTIQAGQAVYADIGVKP